MARAVHEAASGYPLLTGEKFKSFKADIEKRGQQLPIYRLDGQIIDGRNRLKAVEELGLEPWIEDLDPEETGDPKDFVKSMNLHRRQLTVLQQAEREEAGFADKGIVLKGGKQQQAKKSKGGRPSKNGKPENEFRVSLTAAAKSMGTTRQAVLQRNKLLTDYRDLPKEQKTDVDSGELTVPIAKKVAERVAKSKHAGKPLTGKAAEKAEKTDRMIRAFRTWWKAVVPAGTSWVSWFKKRKWDPHSVSMYRKGIKSLIAELKEMERSL